MTTFVKSQRGRAASLVLLAGLILGSLAEAREPAGERVIPGGWEAKIVGLIAPHAMGDALGDWTVGNIRIERTLVHFQVTHPDGREGELLLRRAPESPVDENLAVSATSSFLLERAGSPEAIGALKQLELAIRDNDRGDFWEAAPVTRHHTEVRSARRVDGVVLGLALAVSLLLLTMAVRRFRIPDGRRAPGWMLLGCAAALPMVVLLTGANSDHALRSGRLLLNVARDGIVMALAAGSLLLAIVWRQVRGGPRQVPFALAGLVLVGAVIRLALSVEAPMTAHPYTRVVPLADAIYHGPLLTLISAWTGATFELRGVITSTNLMIAAISPLVIFSHARFVFGRNDSALLAAAVLAFLPMHVRFSASDVYDIQSITTSSLTFMVLYTAMLDPSARWRQACFVLLPLLSFATYLVRPENILYAALDVGAIALCAAKGASRRRQLLAAGLVSGAALVSVGLHLLGSYAGDIQRGLSLATLVNAWQLLVNLRMNTLLNPTATPPGLLLLAGGGLVWLWRTGERPRSLYLTAWLFSFFVVMSYVVTAAPEMQARYHMNLVSPFVLMVGAAAPLLLRAPRTIRFGAVAYLVAMPVLHASFIRATDFYEMEEFAFLREASKKIADGCTVVEFTPLVEARVGGPLHASRLERFASRLHEGNHEVRFHSLLIGRTVDEAGNADVLSNEERAALDEVQGCLMVYEGLTCRSHRSPRDPKAPACSALEPMLPPEPILAHTYSARPYDVHMSTRYRPIDDILSVAPVLTAEIADRILRENPPGVEPGSPVTLRLWDTLPRSSRGLELAELDDGDDDGEES